MKFVVLLRGINTGGLTLKMADLKQELQALGFQKVHTILATGNIILESKLNALELKRMIEATLGAYMNANIHCLLRTKDEIEHILNEYHNEEKDYHHYILFCDQDLYQELSTAFTQYREDDKDLLFAQGQDIHWIVKKGQTLGTFGHKVLGSKKYKTLLTSRNISTVKKIWDQLQAL